MNDATSQSRVLTLVFTDLAGSTALKNQRGDAAVGELMRRHRDHITRLATETSGRIMDWAGDGCFLTFDTSSAGVLFALRLQEAHAADRNLPPVRVGIHLGEVTEHIRPDGAAQVEGLAVDVAARICGLAAPDQVLMSSAVYHSARQRLGVESLGKPVLWQSYGRYTLKGVDDAVEINEALLEGLNRPQPPAASDKAWPAPPIKLPTQSTGRAWAIGFLVLMMAMIGYGIIVARVAAPLKDAPPADVPEGEASAHDDGDDVQAIRSLAVLPLDNMSNDPAQDYFADSMTEALIAELVKIKSIRVISRTSVMQYKGTTKTAPEIARELGVDSIVEGSVLKDGNDVRITAQLIDTKKAEGHLVAEHYTGTLDNVIQLQADIAVQIAELVEVALTPEEREHLTSAPTVNIEAYEAYAQGRYFWGLRTREAFDTARRLFEKALQLDPNFARAHAGLADVYGMMAEYAMMPAHEAYARARESAEAALALDPNLGEAYASLALVLYVYDWKWQEAEAAFQKSIALSPNYATAHHWYAVYLYSLRRYDEAFAEIQLAYERDPISPVIAITVAEFLAALGREEEAVAQAETVLRMNPNVYRLHLGVANMHDRLGRYSDALDAMNHALEGNPASSLLRMRVAYAQARAGLPEDAQETLDAVLAEPTAQLLPQTLIARCYLALGQTDRAFEWIEQAFAAKDPSLPRIMTQPAFDAIEDDPRFQDILRRIHFPGAATPR